MVISLAGGLIGALLLLYTPNHVFSGLVPWLILFATVVFAVGNLAPLKMIAHFKLGPRGAMILTAALIEGVALFAALTAFLTVVMKVAATG